MAPKRHKKAEESENGVGRPRPSQSAAHEEIQESAGSLLEYDKAVEKRLISEAKTKQKALDEGKVKHQDFIIDLQNKFSRIALGLATAIIVFGLGL